MKVKDLEPWNVDAEDEAVRLRSHTLRGMSSARQPYGPRSGDNVVGIRAHRSSGLSLRQQARLRAVIAEDRKKEKDVFGKMFAGTK